VEEAVKEGVEVEVVEAVKEGALTEGLDISVQLTKRANRREKAGK
jgi:hypothetical protein